MMAELDKLAGTDPSATPAAPPGKKKGGAPRKDWWDHLWIEMIRRIENGTLDPASAADLERDMLEWLGAQGIYPGDSTLKTTSRNLFKYLKEKRGK
jgi:hypothetical protein